MSNSRLILLLIVAFVVCVSSQCDSFSQQICVSVSNTNSAPISCNTAKNGSSWGYGVLTDPNIVNDEISCVPIAQTSAEVLLLDSSYLDLTYRSWHTKYYLQASEIRSDGTFTLFYFVYAQYLSPNVISILSQTYRFLDLTSYQQPNGTIQLTSSYSVTGLEFSSGSSCTGAKHMSGTFNIVYFNYCVPFPTSPPTSSPTSPSTLAPTPTKSLANSMKHLVYESFAMLMTITWMTIFVINSLSA